MNNAFALGARGGCGMVLLVVAFVAGCSSTTPEQTEALRKSQAIGAKVNFKGGGYEIDFTNTLVEDQDLADLKAIGNLTTLQLAGTRISDAGVEHLIAIPSLKYVSVKRTFISGEGIDHLRKERPTLQVEF